MFNAILSLINLSIDTKYQWRNSSYVISLWCDYNWHNIIMPLKYWTWYFALSCFYKYKSSEIFEGWMINFCVSFLLSKQRDLIVISPKITIKACYTFGGYNKPYRAYMPYGKDELMYRDELIWDEVLSEIAISDYTILERRVKTKLYFESVSVCLDRK